MLRDAKGGALAPPLKEICPLLGRSEPGRSLPPTTPANSIALSRLWGHGCIFHKSQHVLGGVAPIRSVEGVSGGQTVWRVHRLGCCADVGQPGHVGWREPDQSRSYTQALMLFASEVSKDTPLY